MEFTRSSDGYAFARLSGLLPAGPVLREALDQVRDAGDMPVVLLDVGEATGGSAAEYAWLRRFPLPVVCTFEGRLEAGAAGLTLCCDVRLCGAEASLAAGTLDGAGEALLTALTAGRHERRKDGEPSTAEQLLEAGLVSEVTPAGEALTGGQRVAAVMASRGPIALELGKEAIWRGLAMHFEQALRFETDLTLLLQTTKDRAEGVAAFIEKRTPKFTGT